jgi:senataxin
MGKLVDRNGEVMFEQKPEISYSEKKQHWIKASPWIGQRVNPRDLNMPVDGDDGFFPTSGSQFVSC